MRHDISKVMHLNFEYPLSQISFLAWRVYDTVSDVAEKEVQLIAIGLIFKVVLEG